MTLRNMNTFLTEITKISYHTWRDSAKCLGMDTEAFFPEGHMSTRKAKQVCRSCDVSKECLDYAFANNEKFGIWGGMSERERRFLRPRRHTTPGAA